MGHTVFEQERKFNRMFFAIGIVIFLLHLGGLFWAHYLRDAYPVIVEEKPFEILDPVLNERFIEVDSVNSQEPPVEETPFFAAANQQASQLEATDDHQSPIPQNLDGEEDAHKILQGSLAMQAPSLGDFSESIQENFSDQVLDENPISLDEDFNENIQSDLVAQESDVFQEAVIKNNDGAIEVIDSQKLNDNNFSKKQRPKPKARPRVQPQVTQTQGPLLKSLGGAHPKGLQAVDARFSAYGEYLQKMSEIIYSQWIAKINQVYPNVPRNCDVLVSFMLNHDGSVDSIHTESGSASALAICLCRDAILAGGPFEPWSEAMRGTLGDSPKLMKIHFSFH